MYFGLLGLRTPRKESSCAYCKEEIEVKVESPYMLYKNVGPNRITFTIYLHWECIEAWCKRNKDERELARGARDQRKVSKKMGRPSMELTPEDMKKRKRNQYYIWLAKNNLLRFYTLNNEDKIHQGWERMVVCLERLEEVSPNNKYHLGEEASEIIVPREDPTFITKLAATNGSVPEMIKVIKEYKL